MSSIASNIWGSFSRSPCSAASFTDSLCTDPRRVEVHAVETADAESEAFRWAQTALASYGRADFTVGMGVPWCDPPADAATRVLGATPCRYGLSCGASRRR